MWQQNIIRIQKNQPITGGHRSSNIPRTGDPSVFQTLIANPVAEFFTNPLGVIGAAIVHHDHLHRSQALPQATFHRRLEPLSAVEGWHYNGNFPTHLLEWSHRPMEQRALWHASRKILVSKDQGMPPPLVSRTFLHPPESSKNPAT